MADEIPFRSLTIEEQLYFTNRFDSYHSNDFLCDLYDMQEELGVKLDGFDEFYACVISIRRSLSGSIPFSETLLKNFEESFLTVNHKLNELMSLYPSDFEETNDVMEEIIENPSPLSTPQVLASFEAYTPPVTYPEEVEETLGIPIEVGPWTNHH